MVVVGSSAGNTALLESLCKGSCLPHIRLVLPYLIGMPLQSKIGACGVSLSGILKSGKAALVILPISNRDIAAGGYPVISGWGANHIPSGSNLLPENSGYIATSCNGSSARLHFKPYRKVRIHTIAVLCFGNV